MVKIIDTTHLLRQEWRTILGGTHWAERMSLRVCSGVHPPTWRGHSSFAILIGVDTTREAAVTGYKSLLNWRRAGRQGLLSTMGEGEASSIYKPERYVQPYRVLFYAISVEKRVKTAPFGLESGYSFRGNCGSVWTYLSSFGWRSNLSNGDRGQVWKRVWILEARLRVWKNTFFGLKWGQDLRNRAVHLHQEFPGVPPREIFWMTRPRQIKSPPWSG